MNDTNNTSTTEPNISNAPVATDSATTAVVTTKQPHRIILDKYTALQVLSMAIDDARRAGIVIKYVNRNDKCGLVLDGIMFDLPERKFKFITKATTPAFIRPPQAATNDGNNTPPLHSSAAE